MYNALQMSLLTYLLTYLASECYQRTPLSHPLAPVRPPRCCDAKPASVFTNCNTYTVVRRHIRCITSVSEPCCSVHRLSVSLSVCLCASRCFLFVRQFRYLLTMLLTAWPSLCPPTNCASMTFACGHFVFFLLRNVQSNFVNVI